MKLSHNEFRERFPNATITAWVKYRYCGGSIPGLPKEYQAVDYIESNGLQYINLGGISPETNIEIKMSVAELTGDRVFFGIYPPAFSLGEITGKWRGNIQGNPLVDIEQDKVYIAKYLYSSGVWIINGESIGSASTILPEPVNCYLFARNREGVLPSQLSSLIGRIYYFSALGNTNLNLIPCYRKEDDVIGMYDTINGVFYTNSGTGTFIKGENI